jgi:hypothetical protein
MNQVGNKIFLPLMSALIGELVHPSREFIKGPFAAPLGSLSANQTKRRITS